MFAVSSPPAAAVLFTNAESTTVKLPLFRKHSIRASVGGLLIVFVALLIVFGVVDSAHSLEYKADMKNHAYDVVSSKEATCEADGEVIYYCEYCGKESTEIIAKLGHSMSEVARKEATENAEGQIINKCSVCGKEETIALEKLTKEENTTKSNKQHSFETLLLRSTTDQKLQYKILLSFVIEG